MFIRLIKRKWREDRKVRLNLHLQTEYFPKLGWQRYILEANTAFE